MRRMKRSSEKPTFTNKSGVAATIGGSVRNKQGMATAWANILASGTSASIQQSYNIASVTYNSAGNYTLTLQQPISDGVVPTAGCITSLGAGYGYFTAQTATTFTVQMLNTDGVATSVSFCVVMFGGDVVA